MNRMLKWLTPVLAFGIVAAFAHVVARADDAPASQPATASITVTVVDDSGTPQVGAMVEVMLATPGHAKHKGNNASADNPADNGGAAQPPAGKKAHAAAVATATTDDKGSVTLTVPPGDYRIVARLKGVGHGVFKMTAPVNAGDTPSVTVTLHAGTAAKKPTTNPSAGQ